MFVSLTSPFLFFLILLPLQCSEIINSKLSEANYTRISSQPHSSFLWWHWLFLKSTGQVSACKSGIKVPLLPLGPSCPLQTILWVGWFSHVWQPGTDSNGRLACFFFINSSQPNSHNSLQRAHTPDLASSNLKKMRQTVITICSGLFYQTDGQHSPLKTYHGVFKGRRTLWGRNRAFISDEYERASTHPIFSMCLSSL